VPTFKDQKPHKPQIHQVWNQLHALRTKLNGYQTNLGGGTTALLQKETDGRRWFSNSKKADLLEVLEKAVAKADKYLTRLQFAKSCRVLDPRQRPNISSDIKEYTNTPSEQRVFSAGLATKIASSEWQKYWSLPSVTGTLDLLNFWRGLKAELPEMSKRALLVLPITHTAVDVERSFSFYKLARSEKQLALTDQHHIGRISFAMNGLVPRVQP
jgi:hypothetical protein